MAERSIAKEVGRLGLGAGEEFGGEGDLTHPAGVPVGVKKRAPILQPMDALAEPQDILADLGVRFTASAAAAMLSASLLYPIRTAFKSTVGTNLADALARRTSRGVMGGALISLKGARVRA